MRNLTLLFFLTFAVTFCFSQVRYDEIRSEFIRYCGEVEDSIIFKNVDFVDSLAKLEFESGLSDYLGDYADAYYAKYMITKNHNDLIISLNANTRNWEQFGNTKALYSMISSYAGFDCFMTSKYIRILESKIKKNKLDYPENKNLYESQLTIIRENLCPE